MNMLCAPLTLIRLCFVVATCSAIAVSTNTKADDDLAKQALAILEDSCSGCHDGQYHSLDTLDQLSLTAERKGGRDRFIEPGDPDKSYLWTLIKTDVMPKDSDPLSDEEKDVLKQWITDGAEFPDFGGGTRTFIPDLEVLTSIHDHLEECETRDQPFIRYFSLHSLSNNPLLPAEKIRLARAALAKTINSLSRQRDLIEIEAVDPQETVFAVDLRELGWDEDGSEKWQEVLSAYPYGVKPLKPEEQEIFEDITAIYDRRGFFDGFAFIRADWFIDTATRPPLYHTLLEIPETLAEFERQEGFDRESDYLRNQLIRGGINRSNISRQARIIDYHPAERGVWISSDFLKQPKRDPERGNIARFPLGPMFEANPHKAAAFDHAGGEIVFTLPNGLHAYMLIDENGNRIDAGPIEIVADTSMVSGSPEIINGLSCISCHRHGINDFTDRIADSHARTNRSEVEKIEAIFRSDAMVTRIETERDAYVRTLKKVVGRFLQADSDADKPIESFPEPITVTVKLYQQDLKAEQVAAELGIDDADQLNRAIQNQTDLISLGLRILPNGGAIKREHWEARGRNERESIFQRASRKFGYVPVTRL